MLSDFYSLRKRMLIVCKWPKNDANSRQLSKTIAHNLTFSSPTLCRDAADINLCLIKYSVEHYPGEHLWTTHQFPTVILIVCIIFTSSVIFQPDSDGFVRLYAGPEYISIVWVMPGISYTFSTITKLEIENSR